MNFGAVRRLLRAVLALGAFQVAPLLELALWDEEALGDFRLGDHHVPERSALSPIIFDQIACSDAKIIYASRRPERGFALASGVEDVRYDVRILGQLHIGEPFGLLDW